MRVPDEGYFEQLKVILMFLFVSIMRVPDEGYLSHVSICFYYEGT